jgi:hypothetical protein
MSNGITATIRLESHLQLFYGSTSGDAVLLDRKKKYFNFIIHSALELRQDVLPKKYSGDEYYTFELPLYSDKDIRNGSYIIPEKYFNYIENLLEFIFDASFLNHIAACNVLQEAIYGFANLHGMPVSDKLFEMLKKRYYRDRKKSGLNVRRNENLYTKNPNNLSLICPQIVTT